MRLIKKIYLILHEVKWIKQAFTFILYSTEPICLLGISSSCKLPKPLSHIISLSHSLSDTLSVSLSLFLFFPPHSPSLPPPSCRKAVEEAMDPGLAGITAYVSQDCTGMKDDPAVEKTGYWARRPYWPFFFHHLSAAWRLWRCLEGWQESRCIYSTTNISTTKSITSHSNLFLTPICWVVIHVCPPNSQSRRSVEWERVYWCIRSLEMVVNLT